MTEQRPVVWSGDGDEDQAERLSPTPAISDLETSQGLVEPLSRAAASSTLAVPIRLRGQPIGVLGFKEEEGRQWSEDDVALAEALAEQFALAADNLRLLDETQRRAAHERLTSEITDKMRSATDMDALMQTAIQEMGAVLGATSAFVQLAVPSEPAGDGREKGIQPPTERAGR
jgi:GAF domain-containing protein